MHRRSFKSQVFLLVISLAVPLFTGCLEVTEEIHVKDSGEANVAITIKGDKTAFSSVLAMPAEVGWQVDTLEVRKADGKGSEMTLRAAWLVEPGQEFPHTFANRSDSLADRQLQFPTELKVWTEGKRTFYEFKRTYLSRRHLRFIGEDENQVDEDLEKRVMDKGILNVSESDRTEYLNLLAQQFQQQIISFYQEAMGEMIIAGQLRADLLGPMTRQAEQILQEMLSPQTVLSMMSLPDDSVIVALDDLKAEAESRFIAAMKERTSATGDITGDMKAALARINLEWAITEKLDNDWFQVDLYLPGILIKTNGKVNPDNPGSAGWIFEGKDLHDRSIGLYALSVVEQ